MHFDGRRLPLLSGLPCVRHQETREIIDDRFE
jgi:hypothetical protein